MDSFLWRGVEPPTPQSLGKAASPKDSEADPPTEELQRFFDGDAERYAKVKSKWVLKMGLGKVVFSQPRDSQK
jgi:hypothetical protein